MIQRYRMYSTAAQGVVTEPSPAGRWVTYDSHQRIVEELLKLNDSLRKALNVKIHKDTST
jgi:hypothetical protein